MEIGHKINLYNRDHRKPDVLELVSINNDEYVFKVIPYLPYANSWRSIARENSNDFNHPYAIDPPGGPYMAIDVYKLDEDETFILRNIECKPGEGFYLTFKQSNYEN